MRALRKYLPTFSLVKILLSNKPKTKFFHYSPKVVIFIFMRTLTLKVPDSLDMDDKQIAILVSSRLYEQGRLSLGQAAEVAGLSKRAFAELLGSYNVSIFNFPASDLSKDVVNA
jgi:predicted HTH domain antitoxin